MKELLTRFHLNGNIIGFHPQTEKLQPPIIEFCKEMSDLSDAKQELTLQACLFVPNPPKFLFSSRQRPLQA